MESEQVKLTAPYLPFRTFLNTLDHLKAIGIPHKIDRGIFPSFSGIIQGQVLGTFRFLGLIDEHGKPSPDLATLIEGKERKPALKELLKKRYCELVSLDLTKVSPSQFDNKLSEYGVTGATHQKAKSFFLRASRFAELPLTPLLTRKTRSSSGTRRKKSPEGKGEQNGDRHHGTTDHISGTSKTITLRCGGELTLSLTVNLFDLVGEDREFVFGIVDKIQNYKEGSKDKEAN